MRSRRNHIAWLLVALLTTSFLHTFTARRSPTPVAHRVDVETVIRRHRQSSKKAGSGSVLAARDRFIGDLQRLPSHALAHGRHHAARALDHAATAARRLSSSPSFPHYVAGITAGVLECVVGHPLDTIRVRIITAGTHPGAQGGVLAQLRLAFTGTGGALPGIQSLYRGMKSELLSAAVAGSLLFGVNDFIKRWAR